MAKKPFMVFQNACDKQANRQQQIRFQRYLMGIQSMKKGNPGSGRCQGSR